MFDFDVVTGPSPAELAASERPPMPPKKVPEPAASAPAVPPSSALSPQQTGAGSR
jgi:hypothetical protein